MKTYELPEFTFLLKLGLWTGGEVGSSGYISPATKTSFSGSMAGLTGIELSGGVRLEKYELSEMNGMSLFFSIYEPYRGTYQFWVVSADDVKNPEDILFAVAQQKETLKMKSSGGKYTSFRKKSKYLESRTTVLTRSGRMNI